MVLARGTCHIAGLAISLRTSCRGGHRSTDLLDPSGVAQEQPYTSQKLTLVTSEAGLGCVSEKLASLFEENLVVTLTEQLWRNAQPVL
jgi:hypothetical protein